MLSLNIFSLKMFLPTKDSNKKLGDRDLVLALKSKIYELERLKIQNYRKIKSCNEKIDSIDFDQDKNLFFEQKSLKNSLLEVQHAIAAQIWELKSEIVGHENQVVEEYTLGYLLKFMESME